MKKIITIALGIVFFAFGMNTHPLYANHNRDFRFHSQAGQDQFVYSLLYNLLGKKDTGYYLEIGAGDPSYINNTYFFEKNYDWKGVSIDIVDWYAEGWSYARKNLLVVADATTVDYNELLSSFPSSIDYLSLDIDDNYDIVLQQIPFNDYHFKVITIEHDFYRHGDVFREKEREILSSLGYYLLCPDVAMCEGSRCDSFEDWWIYPGAFSDAEFAMLKALDLKAKNYLQILRSLRILRG